MERMISARRLVFATLTGTMSLLTQVFVPGIPLGWGGKIELADIPAIIGAVFTGPVGGVITGLLYGAASPVYLALIPSSVCSFALLGYLSNSLKVEGNTVIAIVIYVVFTSVVNTLFFKLIYYGPAVPFLAVWIISLWYNVPGSIVSILLLVFIERKMPWLYQALKEM